LCVIPKNRSFDKMFFDQKEKIVPVLEAFREGRLVPANLPIDNKLGILLHGPPGTGKTGFISALANFLGRHILLCDMSKIRTRAQLSQIFTNHKNEQFIFVFEEFDTMPGVCKREGPGGHGGPGGPGGHGGPGGLPTVEPNATSNPAFAMMLMAEKEKSEILREMKNDMAEAKDKIDLGFLLRKLDGLESGEGRIIVATTNHPERIDPALLRPGRFGIHLNLGNCSHEMLENIIWMGCAKQGAEESTWTKEELAEKVKEIPEGKWSPAFVIQTCLEFGSNIEKVLEVLGR
jgi:chaperone BCS1